MKNKIINIISFFIIALLLNACSGATSSFSHTNLSYGYSKDYPIKVGGNGNGPRNEINFLSSLVGANGENLTFERSGSCCAFETKNSSFGTGMLDIYIVRFEGSDRKETLYLNMYDYETPKAPTGFRFK